jgi:hypothetical protein
VDRPTRTTLFAGAAVLFVVGVVFGFLLGRSGNDEELAIPTPSPELTTTVTPPTEVVTPTPGEAPAISSRGQVLREGDRNVTAAPTSATCAALITPGTLGDCGEVIVADQRVVWVVEQAATPTGAPAFSVRISTFVPDENGWVEWLQASDPAGERWSDVNVLAADLTGDGVQELLVGFRSIDEDQTLEYDIVGYSEIAVPEVLAHPDPAPKGSVIVSGGTIQEYSAQYPNGEPVCCPAGYLRQSIAFVDSFFRVVDSETVVITAVPPSEL